MSVKDDNTHEEKIISLLQSMIVLQATAISLSISQADGMSDGYITDIVSSVEYEMGIHGLGQRG